MFEKKLNFPLSPILLPGHGRFVLTWGDQVCACECLFPFAYFCVCVLFLGLLGQGDVYVWHNSFSHVLISTTSQRSQLLPLGTWLRPRTYILTYAIFLIYMCDRTHSLTCAFPAQPKDSDIYPTYSYVWYDSCVCITRFVHMRDMTLCDTTHFSNMTHPYVWLDSSICVTWLIHMCDMTHPYVWHDSSICVTWLISTTAQGSRHLSPCTSPRRIRSSVRSQLAAGLSCVTRLL